MAPLFFVIPAKAGIYLNESQRIMFCPELLAPAGNLDKLRTAILYGADAVYFSGQKFGLRSAADNFTLDEISEGVSFAHQHGAKAYITLNAFLHDDEIKELPAFLKFLKICKIDAVIASDLGVISCIQKNVDIPIHLSTQASCLNKEAALFWKKMGVTRLTLGREVSIPQASEIKKDSGLEVEVFIHGAMCMAYSGNCTISNFTQGRDSNRGGCAHSCRFDYNVKFASESIDHSFFMSSKDLQGLGLVCEFTDHKIDSLKIEGRMKSSHYVGATTKVYKEALLAYCEGKALTEEKMKHWVEELKKPSHREYTQANLWNRADQSSIVMYPKYHDAHTSFVGIVQQIKENESMIIDVRASFVEGEELEVLTFKNKSKKFKVQGLKNMLGEPIEKAKINTLVKLQYIKDVQPENLVRGVSAI